jgi:REP element-mobilizing transposase RayT
VSLARPVLPEKTYLVTRRATRRHFLFRPDEDRAIQRAFLYCVAVIAGELGVLVHAAVLMSDHYHLVVTDVRGRFPDFVRELHRTLAGITKCHRGWAEEVFNKSQTSRVELVTPAAIANAIGYTIANPVAAFLVRFAHEWPGVTTRVDDIGSGRVIRIERSERYLDPENPRWPAVAELTYPMPRPLLVAHGSLEAARAPIRAALERHVKEAHDQARRDGKSFLGARRATRVPFTGRASSYEDFGACNPTFAAAGDPEAAARAHAERRSFLGRYADALRRWRSGERTVVFPCGTWLMHVLHRATVARPP